jgi:hypothetical protein
LLQVLIVQLTKFLEALAFKALAFEALALAFEALALAFDLGV